MKFKAYFKTPDAATHEAFIEMAEFEVARRHGLSLEDLEEHGGHIDPEREDLVDEYNELAHEMAGFAERYVKWGEHVVVEFDTEAGTVTVLEASK